MLNKVIIIGNVCKDPEIRSMRDGREVSNLTIATNEVWKDKNSGEKKERAEFHRVVCFNPNLINVIKNYVKKGSKLYIEGQIQTKKWTDKEGIERYSTEIVLQGFNALLIMLDGKPQGGESGNYQQPQALGDKGNYADDSFNSDIPF